MWDAGASVLRRMGWCVASRYLARLPGRGAGQYSNRLVSRVKPELGGDLLLPELGENAIQPGSQGLGRFGGAVPLQLVEDLLHGPDARRPGELDNNIAG